ncbi:hypothetical protein MTP99_015382 [Tenebrio molitor]|nr:hypothetical protein MTP99_015382 [Tenebrio molitor]
MARGRDRCCCRRVHSCTRVHLMSATHGTLCTSATTTVLSSDHCTLTTTHSHTEGRSLEESLEWRSRRDGCACSLTECYLLRTVKSAATQHNRPLTRHTSDWHRVLPTTGAGAAHRDPQNR